MSDEEEREDLIARMRSVGTTEEVNAVSEEARRWLSDHPGDHRVAAAMQRLEEKQERLEDRERGPNWVGAAVLVAATLTIGGVVFAFSGSWVAAVIAGLLVGLEVAWLAWEGALAFVERRRRNVR